MQYIPDIINESYLHTLYLSLFWYGISFERNRRDEDQWLPILKYWFVGKKVGLHLYVLVQVIDELSLSIEQVAPM